MMSRRDRVGPKKRRLFLWGLPLLAITPFFVFLSMRRSAPAANALVAPLDEVAKGGTETAAEPKHKITISALPKPISDSAKAGRRDDCLKVFLHETFIVPHGGLGSWPMEHHHIWGRELDVKPWEGDEGWLRETNQMDLGAILTLRLRDKNRRCPLAATPAEADVVAIPVLPPKQRPPRQVKNVEGWRCRSRFS